MLKSAGRFIIMPYENQLYKEMRLATTLAKP
jgi:hypothetical protein